MIEYIVVHGYWGKTTRFEQCVEEYIKAGYVLQGGLCVKDGDFAQAMTREKTAKKQVKKAVKK